MRMFLFVQVMIIGCSAQAPINSPEPSLPSTPPPAISKEGLQTEAPAVPSIVPRLVVQLGHSDPISYALFSPDDQQILTTGVDGSAILWDVKHGEEIQQLTRMSDGITTAAFSPDGKQIVTVATDGAMRVWDVSSRRNLSVRQAHAGPITSVEFQGHGNLFVTSSVDQTAKLWSIESDTELNVLKGHADAVNWARFLPDGRSIITISSDRTARTWDANSGQPVGIMRHHESELTAVAIAADGKLAATADTAGVAIVWDVSTCRVLTRVSGHRDGVRSIAFSPDSKRFVTAGEDKTCRIWNTETGGQISVLKPHGSPVSSAVVSPDGTLVFSISDDGAGRLWRISDGHYLGKCGEHSRRIVSGVFSADGRQIVTASDDQTAQIWDVQTRRKHRTLTGILQSRITYDVVPDDAGLVVAGGGVPGLYWPFSTGQPRKHSISLPPRLSRIQYSSDGKVLAGSDDRFRIHGWNLASGTPYPVQSGHEEPLTTLSLSRNGDLALTTSLDGTARLWRLASGESLELGQPQPELASACFSPNDKMIVTVTRDGVVRVWNSRTAMMLRELTAKPDELTSVAFGVEDDQFVTASFDGSIQYRDAHSGQILHQVPGQRSRLTNLALSSHGLRLVAIDFGGTGTLLDKAQGEILKLEGQIAAPARFFLNDRFLAGLCEDSRAIGIWNTSTGELVCRLYSFANDNWAVVDRHGRFDASNGGDVSGVHWVVGLEPIELHQLKLLYFEPGLLAKLLQMNNDPLRSAAALNRVQLHPEVAVSTDMRDATVRLKNRGGGIGRVEVLINGKELIADARGAQPDPNGPMMTLRIPLADSPLLIPGKPNSIEIIAWNADGYLSSRGAIVEYSPPEANGPASRPELYAIVAGVSKYASPALNLRYAAKDATDFAAALELGGLRWLGDPDKVHVRLLSTDGPASQRPTKTNLQQAFLELARRARAGDIVVIYLSGHGIALQHGRDLYAYLTQDALSTDALQYQNPAVLAQAAVTSEELVGWIKEISATHQVMILDTCAAGAAATKLMEHRSLSSNQVRAIDRLRDRTGFHVLMGCAADRVSYEASQYSQGLLTYAILQGLRGPALREGEFVDVSPLFQYAADRVPFLAGEIGGIQRPQIMAPRGASFDIGQLLEADRQKLPKADPKPLLLRPSILNRDEDEDTLRLTALIRQSLASASQPVGRGQPGRGVPFVYVDADDLTGALQLKGSYVVVDGVVKVRLRLRGERGVIELPSLERAERDLPQLVMDLVDAVIRAIESH